MGTSSLKDITVSVICTGFFVDFARMIAPAFKKVNYFCEWRSGYPTYDLAYVGTGVEGLNRVDDHWDVFDETDLYIFTDCYFAGLQQHLESMGKICWGGGSATWMETDRFRLREWQKEVGISFPDTEELEGIDELSELPKDRFIKLSKFRGDQETFKLYDKARSEQRLNYLKLRFGKYSKHIPILSEKKIDGTEWGWDGWTVNGQHSLLTLFGQETKDTCYLGKIGRYDNLPLPIKQVTDATMKVFREEHTRSFVSNELRIDKSKKGFLTDMTMRLPNPPYQAHCTMLRNLPEIIWNGANGILVQPQYKARYVAIAIMDDPFASDNEIAFKIKPEVRDYVYIMNLCVIDGIPISLPLYGLTEVGAVVGVGNTIEEAIKHCKKNAEGVEADSLEIEVDVLDKALKDAQSAREYGIVF